MMTHKEWREDIESIRRNMDDCLWTSGSQMQPDARYMHFGSLLQLWGEDLLRLAGTAEELAKSLSSNPAPAAQPAKHAQTCEWPPSAGGCGKYLTGDQCATSKAAVKKFLCPDHLAILQRARAAKTEYVEPTDPLNRSEEAAV